MSREHSWPIPIVLGLALAVVVGIPWAFKLLMAPPIGAPCGGGFDCRALDGRCVIGEHGSYCTNTCESDDECPSSGHCGIPEHDPWRVWFSASPMSERFCVPGPRPPEAAPGERVMPGAMPEAQFGRQRSAEPHAAPKLDAAKSTH